MYLTHLSLTNFRAFARLDMDLPRRTVLLVGNNAQGKTTILEAVYFLATFTSFHAQTDRQVVNFVAGREPLAVARLVADFQAGRAAHRMEVRLIQEINGGGQSRLRKEILLDGVKRTSAEALGAFNAVIFLPQMTRIFENGPEERRRYINLTLSQVTPGYAQSLSEYSQAITQRNALLKLLAERGGDAGQLAYWDDLIADRGARLMYARIHALQEIERIAARIHLRLTANQEVLRLEYVPSYDPLPRPAGQFALALRAPVDRGNCAQEEIRKGFMEHLASLRREEIARGVTTCGPHRDELRFLANELDLSAFGSRGQVRTALLSLKLAEVAWFKEKTGQWPVLLLDETLAELDAARRHDLLGALSECEQAFLTTTDLNLFEPGFVEQAAVWRVVEGQVFD